MPYRLPSIYSNTTLYKESLFTNKNKAPTETLGLCFCLNRGFTQTSRITRIIELQNYVSFTGAADYCRNFD